MTPVLVFDIETIPDVAGLRAAWDLADLPSDEAVVEAAFERRRLKTGGSDFLPHHLHRVVAISCVFRDADGVRVRSLGTPQDDEVRLIQDFYKTVDRYVPRIVSWNGGGFDLPVLNYRALRHGIASSRYWDTGDRDREFRFNNYLNRYHSRHLDLMDLLAMFTNRANAPLDEIAKLCGFPGKLGMDGSQVWSTWKSGGIEAIRNYCETDVANTWLVYCRYLLISGELSREEYEGELALFRDTLGKLPGPHWVEYLDAWPVAPGH
jgi:predicted PolB exonuclease-like 3'-5' exonuclease